MSALLIAEHNNKEIRPFTLNAITAASQIDQDLHVLVIGKGIDAVCKSVSEIPNVKKVIQIDNDIYENYLAENFTPVIVKQAENYSHIISSANSSHSPSTISLTSCNSSASSINSKFEEVTTKSSLSSDSAT